MNTRATTDGVSRSRRRRDRNWWLTLPFAVLIVIDLLYLVLGLASLPRFYQRVSTLTVAPYYQAGNQLAISNELVQVAADARGMSLPVYAVYWMLVSVSCAAILGGVGGLVLWRARGHWFGWFTAHVLLFLTGYPLVQPLEVAQLLPAFWIELGAIVWPLVLLYFFLFPNGRAVPHWARWLLGVAVTMHFLAQLAGMLASIQVVPGPIVESLLSPLEFLISTTLIFSLVCQTYRYVRVSTTAERLQTRWFVVGFAAFLAISSLSAWVPANAAELDLLSTITLPLSIAISILRYRLWDIDVIIRRTLVYGALTALLAVVYIGSVVSLQTLLRPLVGTDTALATVASTLAIAALFQPLRHRMQALIDRHFYRRKYDAQQTVAAFSARLRAETDLETLVHDLTTVVQETMQPTQSSLWLRDESRHAVKQRSEAR